MHISSAITLQLYCLSEIFQTLNNIAATGFDIQIRNRLSAFSREIHSVLSTSS